MGFLSKLFKSQPLPTAEAPSAEFPTPMDAIAHLVDAIRTIDGSWATLHAGVDGKGATVQFVDGTINLLTTEVQVDAVLADAGLADLAKRAEPAAGDHTLWQIDGATPEEMAVAIDVLFARHFGLGQDYQLRGRVES